MVDNIDDELERRASHAEQREVTARGAELLQAVDFGLQVGRFIDGPICRQMQVDSDFERDQLTKELVDLNPRTDLARIDEVRLRIMVLREWQSVLVHYVTAGEAAQDEYTSLETAPGA